MGVAGLREAEAGTSLPARSPSALLTPTLPSPSRGRAKIAEAEARNRRTIEAGITMIYEQ